MCRLVAFLLVPLALVACGGSDGAPPPPPPPTVTAAMPAFGPGRGATPITVTGSGFTVGATPTVRIGGVAATDVVVLDDGRITCTTPPHADGAVAVEVVTAGGAASLATAFTYFSGLFAADGKQATAGNLYLIDPTDASATVVGPIGFGLSGLALSPTGTLYGVESGGRFTRSGAADIGRLFMVHPLTGAATVIGALTTGAGEQRYIGDVTFTGSRLVGVSTFPGTSAVVEIDPATAEVTLLPPFDSVSTRYNMTANAAGLVHHLTAAFSGATLFTVDVDTGVTTQVVATSGFVGTAGPGNTRYNALVFHLGTLYAVDNAPITGPSTLIQIDAAGVRTEVGALPEKVDCLVSTSP